MTGWKRYEFEITVPKETPNINFGIASGLNGPTGRSDGTSAMTVTPDGRVLITTTDGIVKVVQNGILVGTPALSLNVLHGEGTDRGLLNIMVDPNFASNGYVYLFYVSPDANGTTFHNRLSRFIMTGNNINAASETILKELPPEDRNVSIFHMGGGMLFGPDGKIYLGVGDQFLFGGTGQNVAQDLSTDFGKILRLNPDGSTPSDNPFASTPGTLGDIYAYGFREPFRLSIDPSMNGIMVGDVGESAWEEVDGLIAGGNYGWARAEGPTNTPGLTSPLYAYSHDFGLPVCSGAIVGGPYSSTLGAGFSPDSYYFGDFCAGWIKSVNLNGPAVSSLLATDLGQITALTGAPGGGLYYLTQSNNGQLGLITSSTPEPACLIPLSLAFILMAVGENRRVAVQSRS